MSARILLQLLIAAILVGCGPSTEAPSEEVGQALRERIGAELARGDREAALAAVGALEAELPDTPEALLEIAAWYQRAGDASRASWLLEPAVRRFPDRADLRVALARVSLVLGNPARAREAVLPVDEAAAEHPAALVLRAQAELLLGDIEQALGTLTEAETRYPDRPEARLVRIQTLLSEKRTDEARAAIEEARAELAGEDEEAVALRRRLDVTLAQLEAEAGEVDGRSTPPSRVSRACSLSIRTTSWPGGCSRSSCSGPSAAPRPLPACRRPRPRRGRPRSCTPCSPRCTSGSGTNRPPKRRS
jgi:predicted Zn-dependent protease